MNRKAHRLLSEIERVTHEIDLWKGYLEWLKAEFEKAKDEVIE